VEADAAQAILSRKKHTKKQNPQDLKILRVLFF